MIAEGFEYYLQDLTDDPDSWKRATFIAKIKPIIEQFRNSCDESLFQAFIDIDETYRDIFHKSILD